MDEPLCARCARHMPTCCQTREVFCGPGDRRRIAAFLGRDDFTEVKAPDDPVYLPDPSDDPIWAEFAFTPDGQRQILRHQGNGDCVFLGERGCTLPLETRPLICRLYPYDYDDQGLKPSLSTGCPLELLAPGQGLLEALEMTDRDQAERWRHQLYDELQRG